MVAATTACAKDAHVPHKHDPIGNWNNIYLYNVIQSVPVRNKARWRGIRSRREEKIYWRNRHRSNLNTSTTERTTATRKRKRFFVHGRGSRQFHTEVPNDDCQWIASSSNRSNRSICSSIMCGTYNKMPHTHVPNVKFTSKHSLHTHGVSATTQGAHHISDSFVLCVNVVESVNAQSAMHTDIYCERFARTHTHTLSRRTQLVVHAYTRCMGTSTHCATATARRRDPGGTCVWNHHNDNNKNKYNNNHKIVFVSCFLCVYVLLVPLPRLLSFAFLFFLS